MKKVLITGANSFIARNLVEQLSEYELHSLTHEQLDLLDFNKVFNYLKQEKFDIVIHTATHTKEKEHLYTNNMFMFINLYSCQNLYDKMIYFGSGAEYNRKYIPKYVKEDFFGKYKPESQFEDPYFLSKYYMNTFIEDTNIYNLRLFATFGKYDKETRPIPSLCLQALESNSLNIKENSSYDFLYISDICKIVKWFIENKPKYNDYNICTGVSRSFYSIAEIIHSFVEEKQLPINIKNENTSKEYSGDNSRLLNEMKNFEFTPFYDALKKVFDWYKESNE